MTAENNDRFVEHYLRTRGYDLTDANRGLVRTAVVRYASLARGMEDRSAFLDRTMGKTDR